jgi:transcription elongation factor
MKHILLLSIAMIFATPAWAAEEASATAEKPAAQAAAPAEAPKKAHKKSHKPHAHKQETASENMQVRPVATAVDAQAVHAAQAAQAAPKIAPVLAVPRSATVTCGNGCGLQLCGGLQVCAKNKPYPACSTPCP